MSHHVVLCRSSWKAPEQGTGCPGAENRTKKYNPARSDPFCRNCAIARFPDRGADDVQVSARRFSRLFSRGMRPLHILFKRWERPLLCYNIVFTGGMAEWFKAAVLKTVELYGSVGSNPTPSAIYPSSMGCLSVRRRNRSAACKSH